jgi:hypothetical protein
LVAAELVRFAAYDKRHRFSFLQGCIQALLDLINHDRKASASPMKAEAKAVPIRRQLRVDGHVIVPK